MPIRRSGSHFDYRLLVVQRSTNFMDMNRAFFLHKEDRKPQWRLIDASGKTLGRLVTEITDILRGKHSPLFTPNTDAGDYVVVINAEKIHVTGNKLNQKVYERYSGWIGNKKEILLKDMLAKHPERVIEHAVKGMLPKNRLSRQMLRKLRVYAGEQHPHEAQI